MLDGREIRGWVRVGVWALGCIATSVAAADTGGSSVWVLPPVSPAQLAALVSPDPAWPGACELDAARIAATRIEARYRCGATGGEVGVALVHPSQGSDAGLRTRRFALRADGPLPSGLLAALATQVRAREAAWSWVRTSQPAPALEPHGARWTFLVSGYLLLVLLLGPALLLWRHRRACPPAAPPAVRWPPEPTTVAAAVVVLIALVVRLWLLGRHGITADEACNLEPGFWSGWFLAYESRANPPLFRFLIHLTATSPESLWAIRLPAALAGALSLWLFARLARARTSGTLAVAATALLSISALHLEYSQMQRTYTLWLCLLLGAQWCFERALAGRARCWAGYALLAALAALTHYLTPAYLLAQVLFVARHRRAALPALLTALAPAALALAPLAVPVLAGGGAPVSATDDGGSWVGHLARQVAGKAGLLWLLLLLLAGVLPGSRRGIAGHGALAAMLLLGFLAPLVLGLVTPLWGRYFFPLLPLGLLWLVGRLSATWSELSRGRRALVLVGAALVAAHGGLRLFADLQRGPAGALASAVATSGAPGVLLVAPPYQAHAAYYELTGRRDYWDNECSEPSGAMMLRAGETVVIGVTAERTASDLAQALDRLGGFDVLLAPVTRPPAWATWLDDRCVRLGGAGRDRAVWRCGGAPRRPASGCPEPWSADAADGSAR